MYYKQAHSPYLKCKWEDYKLLSIKRCNKFESKADECLILVD